MVITWSFMSELQNQQLWHLSFTSTPAFHFMFHTKNGHMQKVNLTFSLMLKLREMELNPQTSFFSCKQSIFSRVADRFSSKYRCSGLAARPMTSSGQDPVETAPLLSGEIISAFKAVTWMRFSRENWPRQATREEVDSQIDDRILSSVSCLHREGEKWCCESLQAAAGLTLSCCKEQSHRELKRDIHISKHLQCRDTVDGCERHFLLIVVPETSLLTGRYDDVTLRYRRSKD